MMPDACLSSHYGNLSCVVSAGITRHDDDDYGDDRSVRGVKITNNLGHRSFQNSSH